MTFQDYAARGKNQWWRYGLCIVLGPVAGILLGVAVGLGLMLLHWLPADFSDLILHPTRPVIFFAANGVVFAIFLLGVFAPIAWIQKKRFTDIVGAWSWRRFGAGVLVWGGVLIVTTLVDLVLAPSGFRFTGSLQTADVLAASLVGLGVQTFTEEFIFRGYLTQGLLLATRRPFVASVISGLLFGAMHIPNGGPQAVNAAVFGVCMSLIAIRTGGLAFTFGLHLINNVYAAAVVVSADDVFKGSPALFTQSTPQLMWSDTALGAVVLVALVVVMLRRFPAHAPVGPQSTATVFD